MIVDLPAVEANMPTVYSVEANMPGMTKASPGIPTNPHCIVCNTASSVAKQGLVHRP